MSIIIKTRDVNLFYEIECKPEINDKYKYGEINNFILRMFKKDYSILYYGSFAYDDHYIDFRHGNLKDLIKESLDNYFIHIK